MMDQAMSPFNSGHARHRLDHGLTLNSDVCTFQRVELVRACANNYIRVRIINYGRAHWKVKVQVE